jgi:hypothetical protein
MFELCNFDGSMPQTNERRVRKDFDARVRSSLKILSLKNARSSRGGFEEI